MQATNLVFSVPADGLDLRTTIGPVVWAKGRWPSHDWIDDQLIWCQRGAQGVQLIRVRQPDVDRIELQGVTTLTTAEQWLRRHLGWQQVLPEIDEPVVSALLGRFPGLRPYANGSLIEGLLFSIVGQSISVQAAAITERRLSAMFSEPRVTDGREFFPFPNIADLADAPAAKIRESGVTWRRAEAIVAIARAASDGLLLSEDEAMADYDRAILALRQLPLVGPWTAASALLWGIGAADAHPSGDVALLRAARQAFAQPEMSMKELDRKAQSWRPARAWAARALWTSLLGTAD